MISCCGVKVMQDFSIIRDLAVTTRVAINYSRADVFFSFSGDPVKRNKSSLRCKNYFWFTVW